MLWRIGAASAPPLLRGRRLGPDEHAAHDRLVAAGAADLVMEDNLFPNLIGQLIEARLTDGEELRARAAAAKAAGTISAASDLADLAEKVAGL